MLNVPKERLNVMIEIAKVMRMGRFYTAGDIDRMVKLGEWIPRRMGGE